MQIKIIVYLIIHIFTFIIWHMFDLQVFFDRMSKYSQKTNRINEIRTILFFSIMKNNMNMNRTDK